MSQHKNIEETTRSTELVNLLKGGKSMKRSVVLCLLMVIALTLTNVMPVLANNESIDMTDQEIVAEINAYMAAQDQVFELENQVKEYQIPLSNGETATITHEIKRVSEQPALFGIYTAKLGEWDFTSSYTIAGRGSIKVTTRVNVTHVPDMSASNNDMVKFTASGGKVTAVPVQFMTISGSDASTKAIYTDSWYETSGYVRFSEANTGLNINLYFTQTIAFVGNSGSDRDKISLTLSMGL